MDYLKTRPFIIIEEQLPILIQINHQLQNYFASEKVIFVNDRATAHELILSLEGFACIMYSENAYKSIPYFDKLISIPISDETFGFEIGWIQREDTVLSTIAQEFKANIETLLIAI